jgi:NAD(P)-dependent dehydrogenase (short-subunit alcohol dehydrogenase family)
MDHPAIAAGRVAVITGGASGIGLATAQRVLKKGMRVCLADRDAQALLQAQESLGSTDVMVVETDVSDLAQVERLRSEVLATFGEVALLMNNAGVGGGGGAYKNLAGWQKVLGVNLWGVIHGLQVFTDSMIAQGTDCAIVNTGSKQGITNPPGDAAYNVSKAGIKTVTEQLAHELRNVDGCKVTAHLLVPGFTYTGMTQRFAKTKPDAAWDSGQVADELLSRIGLQDFYVICPDNDVSVVMDHLRIQWNVDDMLNNRPALSRWHSDYEASFATYMEPASPLR